ncbi:MAG: glutamine synthetase [Ruminococcus sp.]|nr:glutamine synthetase [Ruminococcus sp.]
MIYSENEILQYIDENDVKFVKLTFCDLSGRLKNISVLSSEMSAVFERGMKIAGKKLSGFGCAGGRDLFLFPDPQTMRVLPWRPQHGRVIRMFCYIKYADGTHFEGDGRYFLKTAMKKAVKDGCCFRFGTSSEFTLFRCDESGAATHIPHDHAGYCDIAPEDKGENFRRDVCLTLEQMGIHPVSSRHESGQGQHEIDFNASSALSAADTFLSFKSAVKSVADQHGVHASFMPKPLRDDCGNGMHIGINLFHDNDFFGDSTSAADTADELKSAAAGIMKYICDMAVFTNTTANSYSRLGEFSAPRYVVWSDEEADQLIKLNKDSSSDAPIVLRAPDCVCNPYFVFGLMIYASLEGISEKLTLPEKYDPSRSDYKVMPRTLAEAGSIAEKSEFLNRYVPKTVLDELLAIQSQEWKEYNSAYDKAVYEENKYFHTL